MACLQAINKAGSITVTGASSRRRLLGTHRALFAASARRRLLQTTTTATADDTSTCPYANIESQITPAYLPATVSLPVANTDYYSCQYNRACSVSAANGVLVNDTTPSTSGVAWTAKSVYSAPTSRSVVLATNGSFVYTPQT